MKSDRATRNKKSRDLLRLTLGTSTVALLALSGIARAQNAQNAQPTQNGASQPANPEEIIVTARKRSETLLNVPISITAVTGAQLHAQGVQNLEDYAGKVPGLAMFTRGPTSTRGEGATFGIRGVSGGLSDPPVGFYLNDTPLPSVNLKLYDIDTIEVLK